MARSITAKASKLKQSKRRSGLLAAANLGGIGDFETFTLISEMHDRLAERGAGAQSAERPSLAAANSSTRRGHGLTLDRRCSRRTRTKRLSRSALQSSCRGIPQYDRLSGKTRRDQLVLGFCQLVHAANAAARNLSPGLTYGQALRSLDALWSYGASPRVRGKAISASSMTSTLATAFGCWAAIKAAASVGTRSV